MTFEVPFQSKAFYETNENVRSYIFRLLTHQQNTWEIKSYLTMISNGFPNNFGKHGKCRNSLNFIIKKPQNFTVDSIQNTKNISLTKDALRDIEVYSTVIAHTDTSASYIELLEKHLQFLPPSP